MAPMRAVSAAHFSAMRTTMMLRHSSSASLGLLLLSAIVVACSEGGDGSTLVAPQSAGLAKAPVTDPTATFKFPLDDAALAVKSDQLFGDATYSLYAEGVCGVRGLLGGDWGDWDQGAGR